MELEIAVARIVHLGLSMGLNSLGCCGCCVGVETQQPAIEAYSSSVVLVASWYASEASKLGLALVDNKEPKVSAC
jgi:hypothetical protein